MPAISILVPVYNVERYLEKCLKSICSQTITDIEIICIDDGSADSSGDILDVFANEDIRIKVIHKENAGYGAALNAGLEAAAGEYIGIVESDDKIAPQMYETLYRKAKEHNLDFVKAEAYYWFEKINYCSRIHQKSVEDYFGRVLGEDERNIFFDFFMNIWTGIYKRSFLIENNIGFHESPGASYQDNGFWMQTLLYAKRAMWLNKAFYYYRQDNPEASIKSVSKMLAMTEEYEYLEKLLKERRQEELLPYCYSMKLFRLRGTFYRIADEQKYSFYEQVKSDYRLYKPYIRYNKYMDNWIREFLKEPKEYCGRVISKKRKIKERIAHSDGVIVYGAGKRGDIVLRILYDEGLYDKIRCFAVSETPKTEFIADRRILSIKGALKLYPGALVIIAVARGSEMYQQMADNLSRLGIGDYMNGADIEENFYIL